MPVRRGHVAPPNIFIDTIIRKFDGQSKCSASRDGAVVFLVLFCFGLVWFFVLVFLCCVSVWKQRLYSLCASVTLWYKRYKYCYRAKHTYTHTRARARAHARKREREREREIVLVLCYGSRDCSTVSWWLNDPAWQTISWTSQTTVGAASPLCKFHTKFPSLITSQYTDTRPTSPSIDPIKQWQASCREATIVLNNFQFVI